MFIHVFVFSVLRFNYFFLQGQWCEGDRESDAKERKI